MTYTNALKIVRTTGIGVDIVDETLGTGDGSIEDFDFDNGNIVDGSYTLYHAPSGSNDMTDLTETTHYTIDLDAGRIVLTAAGVTALGNDVLYAKYTHSPKISNTVLETFVAGVDEEVEKKTGNYWGPVKSNTEWFDGRRSNKYPTTDEPYAYDWDEPDFVELKYKSIQTLTGVYFLRGNMSISEGYANTTDVTSEMNNSDDSFEALDLSGDYLYIGAAHKFHSFNTILFQAGTTAGTNTLEYYNGTSWTSISVTESGTGVLNLAANGKVSWSPLSKWTKTSVNSGDDLYYVRIKADQNYSVNPEVLTLYVGQDFIINETVPLYQVKLNDDTGKVTFIDKRIPDGTRNVRVDYLHGYTTTPSLVSDLASFLAGIRTYAYITGGSYDDETGYTIGRKSVSIGEVYVNVREVVRQFEVKIESILDDIGKKNDLFVI